MVETRFCQVMGAIDTQGLHAAYNVLTQSLTSLANPEVKH